MTSARILQPHAVLFVPHTKSQTPKEKTLHRRLAPRARSHSRSHDCEPVLAWGARVERITRLYYQELGARPYRNPSSASCAPGRPYVAPRYPRHPALGRPVTGGTLLGLGGRESRLIPAATAATPRRQTGDQREACAERFWRVSAILLSEGQLEFPAANPLMMHERRILWPLAARQLATALAAVRWCVAAGWRPDARPPWPWRGQILLARAGLWCCPVRPACDRRATTPQHHSVPPSHSHSHCPPPPPRCDEGGRYWRPQGLDCGVSELPLHQRRRRRRPWRRRHCDSRAGVMAGWGPGSHGDALGTAPAIRRGATQARWLSLRHQEPVRRLTSRREGLPERRRR
eukprot:COSAG01_NODE_3839_length_5646_cov_8.715934_5_plen_345_part_00